MTDVKKVLLGVVIVCGIVNVCLLWRLLVQKPVASESTKIESEPNQGKAVDQQPLRPPTEDLATVLSGYAPELAASKSSVSASNAFRNVAPESTQAGGGGMQVTGAAQSAAKAVGRVQSLLDNYGYLRKSYTPKVMGATTVEALTKYQKYFRLPPSGKLDKATIDNLVQPRCGMPDINPLAATPECSFNPRLVRYAVSADDPDKVVAVDRAVATWKAALPGVTFQKALTSTDTDCVIQWVSPDDPDYNFRRDGTVAHADFPPGCSLLGSTRASPVPLPLHFNLDKRWVNGEGDGFDIETIALHELGHILGLTHSNNPNSVMAPKVRSHWIRRALTLEDLNRVHSLYN